jgi:hypothetical protein
MRASDAAATGLAGCDATGCAGCDMEPRQNVRRQAARPGFRPESPAGGALARCQRQPHARRRRGSIDPPASRGRGRRPRAAAPATDRPNNNHPSRERSKPKSPSPPGRGQGEGEVIVRPVLPGDVHPEHAPRPTIPGPRATRSTNCVRSIRATPTRRVFPASGRTRGLFSQTANPIP